tara:strand:- start:65 stop:814 length:750 start_codon:yes stop_codon:yes gene_type:complete
MFNYTRLIIINCIFIFFINVTVFSEEIINDNTKLDNGNYVYDPYEKINRSILTFNMIVDDLAIQPIVNTYKSVTPDIAEKGVSNFFYNLKEPLRSITFLLQGDLKKSINSMGRFVANSTTSLGLYDTSKHLGLKKNDSDMGIVIGKAGINSGPYLVLPLLGPSNFRDLTGKVLDFSINPISIINQNYLLSYNLGSTLSIRAEYDNELGDLKSNSNDLYNSMKLLYHQRRMGNINNDHLRDLPVPQIHIE